MRKILFLLAFCLSQLSGAADFLKDKYIRIDWLAPQSFSPDEETLVGIYFRPIEHWHVYWKNPGDSGAAPRFKVSAKNAQVGEILWPYPTRLPVAHLTNLGYEGETAYFFKVKPNSKSPVKIEVNLEWLVCKEECIPGFGKLTLSRPVVEGPSQFDRSIQAKLQFFEKRLSSDGNNSPYRLEIKEDSEGTIKVIVSSLNKLPEKINLFPLEPDYLNPAQPKISKTKSSFEVIFQKLATAPKDPQMGFLLVADGKAFEYIKIQKASTDSTSLGVLFVLLASALIGGILLNLMPCVFPMISIKAVSLLQTENRRERLHDGLLYTLGVLTTFIGLGAGFLILRHLGSVVGWGFQLQSPFVVLSLIILFWLMALNFLGVFEFGMAIMSSTGRLNWQSSFGTGVLSVFIAAPCTGPFMGTALGATATLPGPLAMLVFISLGLGLALPYLILTMSESIARKIPKPGAWMETLKQFLAFPLFATVLWLLWVLGQQTGSTGWVASGLTLLGISFALWLGKRRKKFWQAFAWIFAVAVVAFSAQQIRSSKGSLVQSDWENYSEEKLNFALQKGRPVFVDFTAAWCITCQVNKKVVLETNALNEVFKKAGILLLRADWTNQDPVITKALAKLGRNSVPVYAFYSGKDSRPRLLPQILTIDMVKNFISTKEEK